MQKNKLQIHIKFIEEILDKFDNSQRKKNSLKKRMDKNIEIEKMENEISKIKLYLRVNNDLHQIFMDIHSDYEYEEVFKLEFFSRDLHKFLLTLRKEE